MGGSFSVPLFFSPAWVATTVHLHHQNLCCPSFPSFGMFPTLWSDQGVHTSMTGQCEKISIHTPPRNLVKPLLTSSSSCSNGSDSIARILSFLRCIKSGRGPIKQTSVSFSLHYSEFEQFLERLAADVPLSEFVEDKLR